MFGASAALAILKGLVGPVFEFLNRRVDSAERIHVNDNATMTALAGGQMGAVTNADNQNSETRRREGKWSPWVVVTIVGFMVPLGFHTWQVVLDSSAWHIGLNDWYLPTFTRHVVGSWKVGKLPGMFEATEHAVIQSLFVGASAALGAAGILKAFRGR